MSYASIRFIKNPNVDEFVAVNGKTYKIGLGKVIRIPEINAQIFIKNGLAIPVNSKLNHAPSSKSKIEGKKLFGGEIKLSKEKNKVKNVGGKRYLAGYIDLGILGKQEMYLFKNENKQSKNSPSFRAIVKDGDGWKEVGVFWIREMRAKDEADAVMEG